MVLSANQTRVTRAAAKYPFRRSRFSFSPSPRRLSAALLLVLCHTASSLTASSQTASSQTPNSQTSVALDLVVDSANAPIGEIVEITIRIESAPNRASAFGFDIVYDSNAITYDGFVAGDLVQEFALFDVHAVGDGRLRLGGVCTRSDDETRIQPGTTGEIATLSFEVTSCPEIPAVVAIEDLVDDLADWQAGIGVIECAQPVLMISDTLVRVGPSSGSVAFEIQNIGSGTLEWETTIELGASWITLDPAVGSGDAQITLNFQRNTVGNSRGGRIRVDAPNSDPDSVAIEILQSAATVSPPIDSGCAASSAPSPGTSRVINLLLLLMVAFGLRRAYPTAN